MFMLRMDRRHMCITYLATVNGTQKKNVNVYSNVISFQNVGNNDCPHIPFYYLCKKSKWYRSPLPSPRFLLSFYQTGCHTSLESSANSVISSSFLEGGRESVRSVNCDFVWAQLSILDNFVYPILLVMPVLIADNPPPIKTILYGW